MRAIAERVAQAHLLGDKTALAAWGDCFVSVVPRLTRVDYNRGGEDEGGVAAKAEMREQYNADPMVVWKWLAGALQGIGVVPAGLAHGEDKVVQLPEDVWMRTVHSFGGLIEMAFGRNP